MSFAKKAQLAGRIGRIASHVVTERLTRPTPRTLADIPCSPETITPDWLTRALFRDHPGAKVTSIAMGERSDGSTSRQVLLLEYNDAGQASRMPSTVFCKASPYFTSRLVAGLSGALESEAGFYMKLRPHVSMETPVGYYAAADPRSGRSVFLLEDISKTRGARFGDPTTLEITRPMAEAMVENLARYHGTFWESPLLNRPWIQTSLQFQENVDATINFEKRSLIGVERSEDFAPAEFLRRRNEIYPRLMDSLGLNVAGPHTLLHSDMHLGNWYVNANGQMGLYDWQCMTRGEWALDVSYTFLSALTVENRRDWEKPLIEQYLDALRRAGGPKISRADAWLRYRQQTFHALIFWLYTIGSGRMQPQMQPAHISRENVRRMSQAIVDLQSFDAF